MNYPHLEATLEHMIALDQPKTMTKDEDILYQQLCSRLSTIAQLLGHYDHAKALDRATLRCHSCGTPAQ